MQIVLLIGTAHFLVLLFGPSLFPLDVRVGSERVCVAPLARRPLSGDFHVLGVRPPCADYINR